MAEREPHEVLGVTRDASEEEVRSAYRDMVKEHHPDVSDADDAGERFVDIRDAYEEMRERAGERKKKSDTKTKDHAETTAGTKNGWGGSKAKKRSSDSTTSEHRKRRREKRKRWEDPWKSESTNGGSGTKEKSDRVRKERLGGLGYGWTLFREGERFYVSKEGGRGRVYIGDGGKTSRQKMTFRSRSDAEGAYEEHVRERKKGEKKRKNTVDLGDGWRLVKRASGYAVEGKGGYLGIDGRPQEKPYWFRTREEAEHVYESYVGSDRKEKGTVHESEGSGNFVSRVTVGTVLIPFLATVTILNVFSSSIGLGTKGKNPYLATALTSVFFGTLSVVLRSHYPLFSFILLSLAVWAGVEFTVMVAGPYTADEIEGQKRI